MKLGVWVQAIRPRTLPAVAALVGALLIQIATNLANDYFDFARGADTAERVGPVRVTQAGLLAPAAVFRAMVATLAGALLVGVYLVWIGGWPVVVIGLASLVLAVAYTAGPLPLAYHGLGDPFVFVFFGLVAVSGTFYVQGGTFPLEAWWAGAGAGALSTAILVVNNLRDREVDERAGKRTLAVRVGLGASRLEYVLLIVLAAAVPWVGMRAFQWPVTVGAAWIGVIAAVRPARRVVSFQDPRELVAALAETARALMVWAVGLSVGLVW